MTEDEAKKALFQIHYEYMMHTPKERDALYEEYQAKRNLVKKELAKFLLEKKALERENKKL